MNKSKLRKEYEARMGVVEGSLALYNERGEVVYYENANGYWARSKYNEAGKQVYYQNSKGSWEKKRYNGAGEVVYCANSKGIIRDNRPSTLFTDYDRPSKLKILTDVNGTQYKLVEITK